MKIIFNLLPLSDFSKRRINFLII